MDTAAADLPELLTFREGKLWVCAWRRLDVVSQGETEREAVDRMYRIIAGYAIIDAREGREPCSSLKPPRPELLAEWEARSAAEHGRALLH